MNHPFKRFSSVVVLLVIILFSACETNPELVRLDRNPNGFTTVSLLDWQRNNRAMVCETTEVRHDWSGVLIGPRGTRIYIQEDAFVFVDNGKQPKDRIKFKLIEVLAKADMIFLNATVNQVQGELLESGGSIMFTATSNGRELQFAPGKRAYVELPTTYPVQGMQLFEGFDPLTDRTDSDRMSWSTALEGSWVGDTIIPDSVLGPFAAFYRFTWPIDGMGWINCDRFYGQDNLGRICVNAPDDIAEQDEVLNWIYFHNINSVLQLRRIWRAGDQECSYDIPNGERVQLLSLYRKGTEFLAASEEITIKDGLEIDLTYAPTTYEDFMQLVRGL